MGWVGGTALFVSREVLNDIGVFDENIFMYGEDIELCMRAHKRHWDVVIDPTAQIVHLQNQSSSSKNALISELTGYIYLWAKHKPLWQKDFALFIVRIGALLRYFIYTTIMPNSHKATAYKEAVTKLRQL